MCVKIWSSPFPSCPVSACSGVIVAFGLWFPAPTAGCHAGEFTFCHSLPNLVPIARSIPWEHLKASESSQKYLVKRPICVLASSPSLSKKDDSPGDSLVEGSFLSSSFKSQHCFLVLKPCPPQLSLLRRYNVKDRSGPKTAAVVSRRTWQTQGKLTSRSRATLSVNPSIWLCLTVRSWEGLTCAGLLFLPFPKPVCLVHQPTQEGAPRNWPWDEIQ